MLGGSWSDYWNEEDEEDVSLSEYYSEDYYWKRTEIENRNWGTPIDEDDEI